jgi:hypothetical protein
MNGWWKATFLTEVWTRRNPLFCVKAARPADIRSEKFQSGPFVSETKFSGQVECAAENYQSIVEVQPIHIQEPRRFL